MTTLKDIQGIKMVGYRYGEAPEFESSWNYAENKPENGVSMASVGYLPQTGRTSVEFGDRKRCYYIGTISDTGGDDEFCMKNIKRITYKEYIKIKKTLLKESNLLVNYKCDLQIDIKKEGWNIGKTYEEIEDYRNKYVK